MKQFDTDFKCKEVKLNAKYLINWTLELKKILIYKKVLELVKMKCFNRLLQKHWTNFDQTLRNVFCVKGDEVFKKKKSTIQFSKWR